MEYNPGQLKSEAGQLKSEAENAKNLKKVKDKRFKFVRVKDVLYSRNYGFGIVKTTPNTYDFFDVMFTIEGVNVDVSFFIDGKRNRNDIEATLFYTHLGEKYLTKRPCEDTIWRKVPQKVKIYVSDEEILCNPEDNDWHELDFICEYESMGVHWIVAEDENGVIEKWRYAQLVDSAPDAYNNPVIPVAPLPINQGFETGYCNSKAIGDFGEDSPAESTDWKSISPGKLVEEEKTGLTFFFVEYREDVDPSERFILARESVVHPTLRFKGLSFAENIKLSEVFDEDDE